MNATQIIISVIASVTAFFVGLREVIKWAFGRWELSASDNRMAQKDTTAALIENTRISAVLNSKMDQLVTSNADLSRKIDGIGTFIVEERTPVHTQPIQRRTPAGGNPIGEYSIGRGRTQGDR